MIETITQMAAQAAPEAAEAAANYTVSANGNFALAVAGAGAAIAVGLVGSKAVEAVGRNPGAFGNILVMGILGMALAEAIAIYALIMAILG